MARPRTRPPQGDNTIYVPRDSFVANIDGIEMSFSADVTRVSAAWLARHHRLAHLFRPIRVHYDVEQATAAPGEKRGTDGYMK